MRWRIDLTVDIRKGIGFEYWMKFGAILATAEEANC
jgi:hypothetical protein